MKLPVWYQDGLSFACTQCGNCCGGSPGYVWATAEEVRRIAEHLGYAEGWLPGHLVRREGFAYSLAERDDYDCVFLNRTPDGKSQCGVYAVRPTQCRTWPFWTENLATPRNWKAAAAKCPGVRKPGSNSTLYPVDRVQELANAPSPAKPGDPWLT